jgi:hypothetical protein
MDVAREHLQGFLQPPLADKTPGTNHIGDDIYA